MALAQVSDSEAEPVGGLNALALVYFKINFTPEQRQSLATVDLEFIYNVSERGEAKIEKINGVDDRAILDSLYHPRQRLPHFTPKLVNGQPQPTLYFMKLRFPWYTPYDQTIDTRRRVSADDFDVLEKSGRSSEIVIGGLLNSHLGNAHEYLKAGGGMNIQLSFMGPKGWGGGLVMIFYGNALKKDYPIFTARPQNDIPPTLLIGLAGTRMAFAGDRKKVVFQVDANYALHNVVSRESNTDDYYLQFRGFSPGFGVHYIRQLGKERIIHNHFSPAMVSHHIDVQAAIRPIFMNHKEASGVIVEIGVGYRMSMGFIDRYRIRPDVQ